MAKNSGFYLFIVLFIINLLSGIQGYLNLYLDIHEVRRLLGLESELYYIRDDIVNHYASNFVIVIPNNVNSIQFTWENKAGNTMPYSINVISSSSAIYPPELNITPTGVVPNKRQAFQISVLCTGLTTAEVNILVKINVSITPDNATELTIRRRKMCNNTESISYSHVHMYNIPNFHKSATIFYFATSTALVMIAIVAMCLLMYYMKNGKDSRGTNNNVKIESSVLAPLARSQPNDTRKANSNSLSEEKTKDLEQRIADLTVQRCRVRLSSIVMEGTFGRVYLGSFTCEDGKEEMVIIKTVTDHASQNQISLLLHEGMSMYSLNHKNILSILRVSIEDHTAPFLLFPYKNTKNLKTFLQKCKLTPEGVSHTLTTQEVVDMALQITNGLQYLHKKHLLHKDLAARNCVVDDKLRVQIADNALSRDLFPSDYHCLGDNENRPVKWMAIETLLHKTFTASADIWSFGVLLWEFTTLAQQPYMEIDPFEIAAYLKDGYRLAQPVNCPDELFAVMAYCWAMNPEDRKSVV